MTNRWSIGLLVLGSILALAAGDGRRTRGLVDDVGKLWSNVFNSGLDQFQEATMRQVSCSFGVLLFRLVRPIMAFSLHILYNANISLK